ncbi:hypothetical protein AOU00_03570 [Paenibacillus polymyxa]|nr:hypothetical protein AOU00_03570 [Paenibacillus polymyxa]
MSEFPIFTQRIAGELMIRGAKLLRMESNRRNPKFNVFVFEDSVRLRQFLESQQSKKSNP